MKRLNEGLETLFENIFITYFPITFSIIVLILFISVTAMILGTG